MNYKGFYIDPLLNIYRNGKQIFTAHWQKCCTIEECQRLIDYSLDQKSNYQQYLQERGLNNREPSLDLNGELENGEDDMRRFEEWTHQQYENDLYEREN